ncbi:MAG: VCBS repeat-containing protein [Planctomycetota bacterium]
MLAADFGDAPEPYPVLLSEDGPRHNAMGPRLGSVRDMESDGVHSSDADGDDQLGSEDEDSLHHVTIQVGQATGSITIDVQEGAGKLDGWIDFDGDGNWHGAFEQVFASRDVVVGQNTLTFPVPLDAVAGTTFSRFRLSTAGGLGFTGEAIDGEVEDHKLTIDPPAEATGVFSAAQTIGGSQTSTVYSIDVGDIDGDGDLDILHGQSGANAFAWHENDGFGNYTQHFISNRSTQFVKIVDLDQDGHLDLLGNWFSTTFWYRNDGSGNFTSRNLPSQSSVSTGLFVADADGDGDLDIFSGSSSPRRIQWLENDGQQNFSYRIASGLSGIPSDVRGADFDGDGDIDLLLPDRTNRDLLWLENDGSPSSRGRIGSPLLTSSM